MSQIASKINNFAWWQIKVFIYHLEWYWCKRLSHTFTCKMSEEFHQCQKILTKSFWMVKWYKHLNGVIIMCTQYHNDFHISQYIVIGVKRIAYVGCIFLNIDDLWALTPGLCNMTRYFCWQQLIWYSTFCE